jgi:glycolate oxidase
VGSRLIADLQGALGTNRVRSRPLELHLFGGDAGTERGEVLAAVFPKDGRQVAEVVGVAASHGVPVVTRGTATGVAGGAVPAEPAVVLVTTHLDGIEIDAGSRMAWVGAGVLNLDLTRKAAENGLYFVPDPSSRAASTVGGNVATDASGPHGLAEGGTASHVLAVEFVTASGEILTAGGAAPDATGLDVRGLLVGSEGTLGIVTRVLVRLVEEPPAVITVAAVFESLEQAAAAVASVIAAGVVPAVLEMMSGNLVRLIDRFVGGLRTGAGALLLAEAAGRPAQVAAQVDVIGEAAWQNGAAGVDRAVEEGDRERLWTARRSSFPSVAQMGAGFRDHDVVVPRRRLVEMVAEIGRIAEEHRLEAYTSIHAGDGNLHPKFVFDPEDTAAEAAVEAASTEIAVAALRLGGSVSGEHGIGMDKRDLMPLQFSAADLEALRRIKDAFDPNGLLNPGKVLPEAQT